MVRFAVIGCGNIAQRAFIPALLQSNISEVSVCVDISEAKRVEIENKFKLPFSTNIEEAISEYNFDAVYISTPIANHLDIINQVARFGKHILCEKSLACNPIEVDVMIEICKGYQVALFEGFMYQFHPQHQYIKNLIDKGKIGKPFHFQAWFGFPPLSKDNFRYNKNSGGGAILDAGAYTLHAARHFFCTEPKNVFSILEDEGHEVEIRGSSMLDFGKGRTAHIVFGFNNSYQNNYSIWGTDGVIYLERAFSLPADYRSKIILKDQDGEYTIFMEPCNHFIEEINYFCSCLYNKKVWNKWYEEARKQAYYLNKMKMFYVPDSYK